MTHKTPPTCNTPERKVPPTSEPGEKAGALSGTDFGVPVPSERYSVVIQRTLLPPSCLSLPAGYLLPPGWTTADVKRMDEEILVSEGIEL